MSGSGAPSLPYLPGVALPTDDSVEISIRDGTLICREMYSQLVNSTDTLIWRTSYNYTEVAYCQGVVCCRGCFVRKAGIAMQAIGKSSVTLLRHGSHNYYCKQ